MHMNEKIRVSILEDSSDFRSSLKEMLMASDGLCYHSGFEDGESACSAIPVDPPDIVLVDIGLPGISGIECISRLKSNVPRLQFLILTIKDQEEEIFAALQTGASGYMLKSSTPQEIMAGIKELHDGGAPMSMSIARKVVRHFQKGQEVHASYTELLTNREKEVLSLLSKGKYYKEIASDLSISIETVKSHCHNIYEKLHVSSRTEALNKYYGR